MESMENSVAIDLPERTLNLASDPGQLIVPLLNEWLEDMQYQIDEATVEKRTVFWHVTAREKSPVLQERLDDDVIVDRRCSSCKVERAIAKHSLGNNLFVRKPDDVLLSPVCVLRQESYSPDNDRTWLEIRSLQYPDLQFIPSTDDTHTWSTLLKQTHGTLLLSVQWLVLTVIWISVALVCVGSTTV